MTSGSTPLPLNYQLLFESIPGNYLVLAPDFTIVGASDGYLTATLTRREEIVGRGLFDVFPDNPADPTANGVQNLSASLHRVLDSRRSDTMAIQKYDIPVPEGEGGGFEERYWSPVNAPALGLDGEIRYLIHRVEDVTDLWRLEELGAEQGRELERLNHTLEQHALDLEASNRELHASQRELLVAKDAAEEANRAKSAFLSRMSHELRTPLNVVLGFGQVLQLDPLEPQQAEAVDYILTAGRHLLELIDEVLDISQIEAGRASLSLEPVRADELLADALTLMRPLASQRRIAIRADLDTCDLFVLADRQRLKQVLLNLLSNAIKYNREGGSITITCLSIGNSGLRIMVTDTGPGIAPEEIGRLFVAFDRLGAEATDVEGTGLGLALSRHLVEAMGGTIGVESTVDVGSTFWIELLLTEAPAYPPEGVSSEVGDSRPRRAERSVLYIEDNLANLNLMERILVGRLGFRLLAAMQGSLGLDLASDHHPDFILLDLHLPDMPGNEVLERLQDNPTTRDIPVVIVSADATPGQIARLRTAGARAYITKPLDLKELVDVIESLFPDAS